MPATRILFIIPTWTFCILDLSLAKVLPTTTTKNGINLMHLCGIRNEKNPKSADAGSDDEGIEINFQAHLSSSYLGIT